MLSLGKVIAMNDAAAPVRPVAAIATSETRHSGVVAPRVSRRPRRRFVRRVVALVMPAVLALGFAGTAAPPASAVTWTNYGSNGVAYTYPTAVGQYVTKFRNGFSTTMTGVSVPGMILGRSPASAGTQMVTYNIAVEQYYGGRWVQVATDGSGTFKSPFSTARIAMPSTVLLIIQAKSARRITAAAMVMRLRKGVTAPRMVTVWEKISGSGTGRGRGEMNSRAAFCSSVEKAKEVISTAVTDLARTGRKAT